MPVVKFAQLYSDMMQDLFLFLGTVFVIILMPYVSGYLSKALQREHLRTEIIFRIASFSVSSSVAIFFAQLYLPLPADWQQNQTVPVLVYIASMAVGILIWKISYSRGSDRAVSNMADRKELARIIVEDDLRPIIKEAADSIISEMKSGIDSFEENFSELTDLIKSEKVSTEERTHDRHKRLVDVLRMLARTIDERIPAKETPAASQNSGPIESVPEQDESPEEQRRKGLEARLTGEEIQSEVHAMVRMKAIHGEEAVCSYDQGEPDIIITRDGKPADVIAVKSYTLTVTDRKGMRNVRGQKVAVSFCPSKDAKAEVEYARNHGLEHIHLIAVNIATRKMIFDGAVEFDQTITLRDIKEDS